MAVVEAQNLYSSNSNLKTVTRLAVVAKGSEQHYPALSPSKRGVKVPVIAQGTKLVLAETARKVLAETTRKVLGVLFFRSKK